MVISEWGSHVSHVSQQPLLLWELRVLQARDVGSTVAIASVLFSIAWYPFPISSRMEARSEL